MVDRISASGGTSGPSEQRVGVFKELPPENVDQVLREGVRCGGSGAKTAAPERRADAFLDAHIPHGHREHGLGRRNVVYGYLATDGHLVDIKTGEIVPIQFFAARREHVLIRMYVDRRRCFVSDLDCYDIVKDGVESSWPQDALRRWAERYWTRVISLDDYGADRFRRPEVMVLGDVDADDITIVDSV